MTATSIRRFDPLVLATAGLLGLGVAVYVRVRVAGPAGPSSVPAGLSFGVILLVLAAALGERLPAWRWRAAATGVAGAAVLCLPFVAHRLIAAGYTPPARLFAGWAVGVALVAVAEEALLRGAVHRLVEARLGTASAIGVTAIAFALLHTPVYGWIVVPLDLAVGVWLGVLRHVSRSTIAPTVAHTLADLAGWWLR